ncbi:MAG: zinc ribbon domain-containing protein [Planctomycetaceae bacterium]|nr:zinc ribbon domain-containing protein [Planctomycetaceae bacterium]
MPTYDYECDACGHKFEQFQSIKDEPLTKCPECKKKKLRRLFGTGAAIVFKGSGFYQTDYRSEGYKKSAAADKPSGESSGASTSKSDSGGKADGGKKSSGDK